ncbi:hypothetical protein, partial [Flavobacterium sp. Root186]|uniref:hypothetical protein n=1 Tax=Flavobacterium sp. Root186 TaxID=1736485 RepID=UPI000B0A056C
MHKITYEKLHYIKLILFVLFSISSQIIAQNPIVTTGVNICKGDSGSLTATNSTVPATTFSGHWNAQTDPRAYIPYSSYPDVMRNTPICSFSTTASSNYTATQFSVSVSGIYRFQMDQNYTYDGMAYIYKGNFTPGTCSGGGTWIIGDDDPFSMQSEPIMTVYLDEGINYTLISTLWTTGNLEFFGDYTWTVTPPPGGQFIMKTLNYWYTSQTGGVPIGWGNSFNPVGVPGSGLTDTNTPGTTTYYVSDGKNDSPRIPVDFVINDKPAVPLIDHTPASSTAPGSSKISNYTSGNSYTFTPNGPTAGAGGIITGMVIGTNYTVKASNGTCTSLSSASFFNEPHSFICSTITFDPPNPIIIGQCSSISIKSQLSAGDYKILDTKWTLPSSPHSSISNTNSLTTNLSGISEGYDEYNLSVKIISNENLIRNGNFELGYSDFTSSYTYKNGTGGSVLWDPGTFAVVNTPNWVHSNFPNMGDHTSGTGKMLVVNGAEQANVKVWSQTIRGVKPHTKYAFSAFLASLSPNNPSILNFSINGRLEGPTLRAGAPLYWNQFYTEWNSGELSGDITIDIVNQQLGGDGNDFALDDLSFAELCETSATLKVTVNKLPTITITVPEAVCAGNALSLTAPDVDIKESAIIAQGWYLGNNSFDPQTILAYADNGKKLTYRVSSTCGQISSNEMPIIVNNKPTTPVIVQTPASCTAPGSSRIRNYIPGNNYTFTPVGPTVNDTGVITGIIENNGEGYTVTSKNGSCTSLPSERFYYIDSDCCNGEMQVILQDDFDSGTSNWGPNPLLSSDFRTTYGFSSGGFLGVSQFGVLKNASLANSAWSKDGDHTTGKNGNGYMLIFDANSDIGSVFYEKDYTGLCAGSVCMFSIYASNIVSPTYQNATVNPKIKIELINPLNNTVLKSIISNELQIGGEEQLTWEKLSLSFTIPEGINSIRVKVSNAQSDTNIQGNDLAIDDVSFSICVPLLTYQLAFEKTCQAQNNTITTALATSIPYHYQWQQFDGTDWVDIRGANLSQYQTPSLTQDTKYRIRYAQLGIDITNNNNLKCSGNKEIPINITSKPETVTTNENICFGQTYTWLVDGNTYNTSGTYKVTNDGCTADQVLNLTVTPKPDDVVTTESICSGQTFTWLIDGNTYSTSGTYKVENNECTADQVLNLTVTPKPDDVVTTESICSGQTFTWLADGNTYSESGTYRKNNDFCTADQVLKLSVDQRITQALIFPETICVGETILFAPPTEGNTLISSDDTIATISSGFVTGVKAGSATITYKWKNLGVCPDDTIATISSGFVTGVKAGSATITYKWKNLGVCPDGLISGLITVTSKPDDIITTKSICAGESYKWIDNITYTTSQTGLRISNDGCTADQVLNLSVGSKPADIVTTESICSGQAYKWPVDGNAYIASGTYKVENDGCTADQVLNLTLESKPSNIVTTESICSGQTYTWLEDGNTYNTSGTYKVTNDGCTADQVLNLTITPKPDDIVTTESICSGQTYTWLEDGNTYSESGTYRKNNDFCTADQVLKLSVDQRITQAIIFPETICVGETILFAPPTEGNTLISSDDTIATISSDDTIAT